MQKRKKGICKIETDKVMMVWENVLFPRLRDINSDSVNGEPVYGNRNELITGRYIMYVHIIHTFIFILLW